MTSGEGKIIDERLKEITRLVEEREQIQTRITKLETAVNAFIELLEDDVDQQVYKAKLAAASKPLGITNAVKHVLLKGIFFGKQWITPAEVRDALLESGFPLSGYSNALAVIHTTLNRLHDQGIAEKEEGKFKLKPGPPNPALAGLGTPTPPNERRGLRPLRISRRRAQSKLSEGQTSKTVPNPSSLWGTPIKK